MKKNKINYIILLLIGILFITGCTSSKNQVISNGEKVTTKEMVHKHCTRQGNGTSGVDVSLNYDIYYTGDILNILVSEEKVTASNQDSLTQYEDAYKKIHENYKGLEYYDTKVERTDDSVTSSITINYDKIDIEKLLEIEGEEDNIIENKQAKVTKWLELAKKFGTKCKEVED